MTDLVVENGRIVAPDRVIEGTIELDGDRIVAVHGSRVHDEGTTTDTSRIDARGRLVMPGIVDIHGDDIEGHLFPRDGSPVDDGLALRAADRANVAAGITTKCHAIAFQEEPDEDRSLGLARDVVDAVETAEGLCAEHLIHARCELTDPGCVEAAASVLDREVVRLVSLMAHVPGQGQFASPERFKEWYLDNRDYPEDAVDDLINARQHISDATFETRIERITEAARNTGIAVASHDDERPEEVERRHEMGVSISEYPVSMAAAERANELGMTVAMGAPNLVRGGSQWGNLGTAQAIDAGVVDTLCADYHPPSLLAAPFVDTGESLPTRVARVTDAPATAIGFDDRGRIEPGARADLIVVDPEPTPAIEHAIVAGREVYRAWPRGRTESTAVAESELEAEAIVESGNRR